MPGWIEKHLPPVAQPDGAKVPPSGAPGIRNRAPLTSYADTLRYLVGGMPAVVRRPMQPGLYGEYSPIQPKFGIRADTIFLNSVADPTEPIPPEFTLAHEMGHRLYYRNEPLPSAAIPLGGKPAPALQQVIQQLHDKSQYSNLNEGEPFAQAFGQAVQNVRGHPYTPPESVRPAKPATIAPIQTWIKQQLNTRDQGAWLSKHLPVVPADAARVSAIPGSSHPIDAILAALQAIGGGVRTAISNPVEQTLNEAQRFGTGQGQFALDAAHAVPTLAAAVRDPSKLRTKATENAGITAAMALAGMLKLPEGEMLAVEHYSSTPGRTMLDPLKAGSSRAGREAMRADRVPAVHVYDSKMGGIEPDIARGNYRYTGAVPAAKVYDVGSDPAGVVAKLRARQGYLDPSEMESAVKKAGYVGFRNTEGPMPSIIKLFKKLDVQPAAPLTVGKKTFGVPHPLNVKLAAQQMHDAISVPGSSGFSFQLAGDGSLVPVPPKGYAVGAGSVTGGALTRPLANLKPQHLSDWLTQNLEHVNTPGNIVGGWVDGSKNAVIEPSTVVNSLSAAKKLGVQRGEQAIGDLATYAAGRDGTIVLK